MPNFKNGIVHTSNSLIFWSADYLALLKIIKELNIYVGNTYNYLVQLEIKADHCIEYLIILFKITVKLYVLT